MTEQQPQSPTPSPTPSPDPVKAEQQPQSPTPSPDPASRGVPHMAVGLLAFGMVLGVITALSEQKGISQTLMTSVLSFVGGVLLSYAGFTIPDRKRITTASADNPTVISEPPKTVDMRKVGVGLASFSFGILLGLASGLFLRDVVPIYMERSSKQSSKISKAKGRNAASAEPDTVSPPNKKSTEDLARKMFRIQARSVQQRCQSIKSALATQSYGDPSRLESILNDEEKYQKLKKVVGDLALWDKFGETISDLSYLANKVCPDDPD